MPGPGEANSQPLWVMRVFLSNNLVDSLVDRLLDNGHGLKDSLRLSPTCVIIAMKRSRAASGKVTAIAAEPAQYSVSYIQS